MGRSRCRRERPRRSRRAPARACRGLGRGVGVGAHQRERHARARGQRRELRGRGDDRHHAGAGAGDAHRASGGGRSRLRARERTYAAICSNSARNSSSSNEHGVEVGAPAHRVLGHERGLGDLLVGGAEQPRRLASGRRRSSGSGWRPRRRARSAPCTCWGSRVSASSTRLEAGPLALDQRVGDLRPEARDQPERLADVRLDVGAGHGVLPGRGRRARPVAADARPGPSAPSGECPIRHGAFAASASGGEPRSAAILAGLGAVVHAQLGEDVLETWRPAVLSLITRRSPMSRFESPSAIRASTSASRGDEAGRGAPAPCPRPPPPRGVDLGVDQAASHPSTLPSPKSSHTGCWTCPAHVDRPRRRARSRAA